MPSRRVLAAFCLVAAVGTNGLAAQQDAASVHPPWHRDHAEQPPNYLRELAPPGLEPIRFPPPPAGEPPAVVRGIYLNAWVFGGGKFDALLALADTTEINAFVIDVKDGTGFLTYRSSVPTALEIGANGMVRARDVRGRLNRLREHAVHPIARIVVAKDPLLAKQKPGWAIHDVDGGLWRDRFGNAWVDAHRDSVWLYAAQIAEEAVMMGFAEVQFDYVRFPDEPQRLLDRAVYRARRNQESRRYAVRRNVALLRDRVTSLGVPFTVDVFGLTTSARTDMGIGQYWEDLLTLADVVLPMVYPSHYYRGAYGFDRPNFEPYGVVRRALEEGLERASQLSRAATIRPYLQCFTLGRPRYTAAEIRSQMQAGYDLGVREWVLWNASGRYPADAFLSNGRSADEAVVAEAANHER